MKQKRVMRTAAAVCLGSSMTVRAAPEVMQDGIVFDAVSVAPGSSTDAVN